LKQALRAWNKRINGFLTQNGFKKCAVEHGVYVKHNFESSNVLIISLYVDGLLVTCSNPSDIIAFKRIMHSEFEMINMGKLSYLQFEVYEGALVEVQCVGMQLCNHSYGSQLKVGTR
jgi:hypothetical protein